MAAAEYFVDFLAQREEDRWLTRAAAKGSEAVFAELWDNPDDAEDERL